MELPYHEVGDYLESGENENYSKVKVLKDRRVAVLMGFGNGSIMNITDWYLLIGLNKSKVQKITETTDPTDPKEIVKTIEPPALKLYLETILPDFYPKIHNDSPARDEIYSFPSMDNPESISSFPSMDNAESISSFPSMDNAESISRAISDYSKTDDDKGSVGSSSSVRRKSVYLNKNLAERSRSINFTDEDPPVCSKNLDIRDLPKENSLKSKPVVVQKNTPIASKKKTPWYMKIILCGIPDEGIFK